MSESFFWMTGNTMEEPVNDRKTMLSEALNQTIKHESFPHHFSCLEMQHEHLNCVMCVCVHVHAHTHCVFIYTMFFIRCMCVLQWSLFTLPWVVLLLLMDSMKLKFLTSSPAKNFWKPNSR